MKKIKIFKSKGYNFIFNRKTGEHIRWGKTLKDDAEISPYGPEIIDCEITTSCKGILGDGSVCSFCYKSNTPKGNNMSFETFKKIADKFPDIVTQIAFGVDANCKSNKDTFKIMAYCRKKGIIPNITVANVDKGTAKQLAKYVGGIAISSYRGSKKVKMLLRRKIDIDKATAP